MQTFKLEVEFFKGLRKGQVWQFCNLDIFQIIEIYESLSTLTLIESNLFVYLIENESKRIPFEYFITNL